MSENMVGNGDIEITRAQNRNFAAGEGVHRMVKESDVWSILMRYQVNAERQYRRAVEDFERLKRLRPEMPNHPNIGIAPDVIEVAPLKEINPVIRLETLRLEPKPSGVEPAAACPVEPSNVAPNAPENDAPEDGTPLAPAASITKTQPPASRIVSPAPGGAQFKAEPGLGRFKATPKPFASLPLRRSNNPRPSAPASKVRRPACRPLGKPAASHPSAAPRPDSQTPLPAASIMVDSAT
jgi:hypothetical protein